MKGDDGTSMKESENREVQRLKIKIGGGNSNMFYVHPENWGRFPI